MKKRRSVNKLELRKGKVVNFDKVKGGLKQPSGAGDTVLCVSREPYCPPTQESQSPTIKLKKHEKKKISKQIKPKKRNSFKLQ